MAVYPFVYDLHYFFSKLHIISAAATTILYFIMIVVLIFFLFTVNDSATLHKPRL